jgi:hypothetical protein
MPKTRNRHHFMLAPVVLTVALFLAAPLCQGAIITLTFTQHFDYGGPLADPTTGPIGTPFAIWTSTFDLSTHPASPFGSASVFSPPPANLQFSILGKPALTWNGDSIIGVSPPSFKFLTEQWTVLPMAAPICTLPCAVTFSGGDSAFDTNFLNISATAKTPDSLAGVAAVPEPGPLALFALGGLGLVSIRRTRRGL